MIKTVKQETTGSLRKYAVCVGIEVFIAFLVIWSNGFFTGSVAVNLQILADAFFTAGIVMTLFAAMMYISGEGALIGIGFVLKTALLTFIPMGRAKHEKYIDYRERKLGEAKERSNRHILVTGLIFVFIGAVLTAIWYAKFYNV